MASPRIDAHHHLWNYAPAEYPWITAGMSQLQRDFNVADLRRVLDDSSLDGSVAVQARQSLVETEWLLGLAEKHAFIYGVVGWVPLVDANVRNDLQRFASHPKLVAVRHVLHDEADDFYMLREDFNRGIALLKDHNLVYDILIFERHLPQTLTFVDRHPTQKFVVDHIAKPKIKEGLISPWKENIFELARRENVYCKLSGMVTEADWSNWTVAQLQPYFDVVLQAFGPKRLMFGTDWPVIKLASEYKRWVDTVQSLIAELSSTEQAQIFGDTAREAYGLKVSNLTA
jgi:L-fuconolactonase